MFLPAFCTPFILAVSFVQPLVPTVRVLTGSPSHGGDVAVYVFDIN